jgi:hypothetical protein
MVAAPAAHTHTHNRTVSLSVPQRVCAHALLHTHTHSLTQTLGVGHCAAVRAEVEEREAERSRRESQALYRRVDAHDDGGRLNAEQEAELEEAIRARYDSSAYAGGGNGGKLGRKGGAAAAAAAAAGGPGPMPTVRDPKLFAVGCEVRHVCVCVCVYTLSEKTCTETGTQRD